MRVPNSLPNPKLAAGIDTLPEIEHVVVLMLENHSYDNLFGMLGRGRGRRPRGDGFRLGRDGLPTATNPYPNGHLQRAFRMPTTCQLDSRPSQEWAASHNAYNNGKNNGFVRTPIDPFTTEIVGAVAMGYWTWEDLPFTYSLASEFPIGDRWFCSVLAQTDPNRRYLIAATSTGMTDDIGTSPGNIVPNGSLGAPASGGTIFEHMSLAGISWIDYNASFPTGATMELYPGQDGGFSETNAKPIAQFFTDAKAGKLPQFSLLDPDYGKQSQENPQDMVVGEAFLAKVVTALGSSPAWRKTILIFTYDEHGGYYDHVPPPAALAPDSVPPTVQPGESMYDGFRRYGFRVPSAVVGPYAKRNHVSHVVYDHTSILAFLEKKWNLPAMTYRDANANDLTDFIDMQALAKRQPTFPELPKLAAPNYNSRTLGCLKTGPGTIPPPSHKPTPIRVQIKGAAVSKMRHGLVVSLETNHGTLSGLTVQLLRGGSSVAKARVAKLSHKLQRVVLRVGGQAPPSGTYTVSVLQGRHVLARQTVHVH